MKGLEACLRSDGVPALECRGCHARAYAEWSAGPHRTAWTNAVFRAEYEVEPGPACVTCHANAFAEQGHPRDDGVSCGGCHVPNAPESPLPDGVSMCARCHQFDFAALSGEGWNAYDPADAVQETVLEWEHSSKNAQTCVDCHMPEGTHQLRGLGDATFVRASVDVHVDASPTDDGTRVIVVLAAADVGHDMPTGDMFRRLRVRVVGDDEQPQARWLGRRFASMPNSEDTGFALRPVLDQRLTHEPTSLDFLLPRTENVRWSVDLFRLPPAVAERRGIPIEQVRIPVHSGTVAP